MRWFRSNKDNTTGRSPGDSLTLPTIIAANIKAVTDLDGAHFVFLLTFNTGEQLVLKAESGVTSQQRSVSHDFGVKIMGVVSAVKAQGLTQAEKLQVSMIDTGISRDFFRAEQFISAGQANWVKAAFQKNLVGMKGYAQIEDRVGNFGVVNEDKKAKAKIVMIQLNRDLKGNTKAWRSLGGIIAVDMLIANSDRINVNNGEFANLGNIQFRRSGKKIVEAVGLDTFDPAQAGRAGDMFSTGIEDWKNEFGKYLKDFPAAKVKLFECMTHGINEIDNIYGAGTCEWRNKEAEALYEGFVSGAEKLKKKLSADMKRLAGPVSLLPKGLVARLQYLGWT